MQVLSFVRIAEREREREKERIVKERKVHFRFSMISNKDAKILNDMMNFFHEVYDKRNDKYCHIACICQNHKNLSMKRNFLNRHAEIAAFTNIFTNYHPVEYSHIIPSSSLPQLESVPTTMLPGLHKRTVFLHLYEHNSGRRFIKQQETYSKRNSKKKSKKYSKQDSKQDSIRNCTLYVIRCNSEGVLVNSKPCYHCINFLKESEKIKRIIYSDENGQIISTPLNSLHNTHITRGNLFFHS